MNENYQTKVESKNKNITKKPYGEYKRQFFTLKKEENK